MYLNISDLVGGVQQRVELVVDLGLAAGADLVVGPLDLEAGADRARGSSRRAGRRSGRTAGPGSSRPCTRVL